MSGRGKRVLVFGGPNSAARQHSPVIVVALVAGSAPVLVPSPAPLAYPKLLSTGESREGHYPKSLSRPKTAERPAILDGSWSPPTRTQNGQRLRFPCDC